MQSVHATPQIFLNGRIASALNFHCSEMFIKYEIIISTNFRLIEGKLKGETFQCIPHVKN